jgi:hypothetical protein
MAVFSTNQTRQFYVVTNGTGADNELTSAGQGYFSVERKDAEDYHFKYVGADGTVMRSDIIKNVKYAKHTPCSKMRRDTKAVGIKSEDDVAVGQPHLIKVTFKNFIGLSDEYTTSVMADFTPKTNSKELLYKNLAITLAKSLSKFETPLAEVYLLNSEIDSLATSGIPVTAATTLKDLEGTVYGIAIVAAKQPHVVGTGTNDLVDFDVTLTPVTVNGMNAPWGEVITDFYYGHPVKNGEVVADMENFYMKERGDQYGNVGWPNIVPTMYLADPTKEYDIFDIHYSYIGDNESCQASEKTLTVAIESSLGSAIAAAKTALGSIIHV